MNRLAEFFIDETNTLSMSRLLLFGSFLISSWIIVLDAYKTGANEGLFAIYIGAFTATYVGGKFADRKPTQIFPQPASVIVNSGTTVKSDAQEVLGGP